MGFVDLWWVDHPISGIEPVSPALAGGFLSTGPPGKPELEFLVFFFLDSICKRHLSSYVQLVSPGRMPSASIHVSVNDKISFFFFFMAQ